MQSATIKLTNDNIWGNNGHLQEAYYHKQLILAGHDTKTVNYYINIYKQFKNKYPNIQDWFNEDLKVRISNNKERNTCYRARIYIFVMAINGLKLDYNYLFSLGGMDGYARLIKSMKIDVEFSKLVEISKILGYSEFTAGTALKWSLYRILLHTGKEDYRHITFDDIKEFRNNATDYCVSNFSKVFYIDNGKYVKDGQNLLDRFTGSAYQLQLCLFSQGVIDEEPLKEHARSRKIDREMNHIKNKDISSVILRYMKQISRLKETRSCENTFRTLNKFAVWLEKGIPDVYNLSKLKRQDIEKYMDYLKTHGSDKFGKPYTNNALIGYISSLKVFFDETLAWEYEDVPQKKIMFDYDLPKRPKSLPRYIPEADLGKLMDAVYKLECPYQRNAIILARWTGARREEIQRLDINALDYYSDGTPKLLIPIGKTNRNRWIPINSQAENAYKELLEIRKDAGNIRGLIDRKTRKETDYLFMKSNKKLSISYLFQQGLETACTGAGLLTTNGKPKYTAHQFRHTMGTTLANNGASLTTIMKVLGHESPEMSLVYATIFDSTVKDEYENAVLNNKKITGGDFAISIKQHELKDDEIDWIKANFHKTYLMTGHCFHHTKEPMCDFADACFFCSKYVTTQEHIPILKNKYEVELKLVEDAVQRGWNKEVSRHEKVASRVKGILMELGVEFNAE